MASSISSLEVDWRVSLGSLRNGGSAGDLALIDTGQRSDWSAIFTPASLYYEAVSDEIAPGFQCKARRERRLRHPKLPAQPIGQPAFGEETHDFPDAGSPEVESTQGGWPIVLSGLKTFLETGHRLNIPMPTAS